MDAAKKQIVMIEGEQAVIEWLRPPLAREGFALTTAACGEDGLTAVARTMPDLVFLDLRLPDRDGLDVCRQLKADSRTAAIPIFIVAPEGQEANLISGLDAGADDYLTKPFDPGLFISRLRVTLRRRQARLYDPCAELRLGDLEISPSRFRVLAGGKHVEKLTLTEFRLLHFLASRPGRVVTREQILDTEGVVVTERAVDVQVVGLRRKLGARARCIESVRGIGYRLNAE